MGRNGDGYDDGYDDGNDDGNDDDDDEDGDVVAADKGECSVIV